MLGDYGAFHHFGDETFSRAVALQADAKQRQYTASSMRPNSLLEVIAPVFAGNKTDSSPWWTAGI